MMHDVKVRVTKKKRTLIGRCAVVFFVGCVALMSCLSVPQIRSTVIGWAKAEETFHGLPTSYWSERIRDWQRHPTGRVPDVIQNNRDTISVCIQLLSDRDYNVRSQAVICLGQHRN